MVQRVPFLVADLGSDVPPLLLHILASVAEQERRLISERTKAALGAAKARGGRFGRGESRTKAAIFGFSSIAFAETLGRACASGSSLAVWSAPFFPEAPPACRTAREPPGWRPGPAPWPPGPSSGGEAVGAAGGYHLGDSPEASRLNVCSQSATMSPA
jgi:hypothetical protein